MEVKVVFHNIFSNNKTSQAIIIECKPQHLTVSNNTKTAYKLHDHTGIIK